MEHECIVLVLKLALVEDTLGLFWGFFGLAEGETKEFIVVEVGVGVSAALGR